MELYIWEGEPKWGVPSMDLKSLQIMAYIKFSGAPVTIHRSSNPFSMQLPSFKCSAGTMTEFAEVSTYLRKNNYSCDYMLSPKQCSDTLAYEQLLKSKLYPALMYLWWVEPKSYYDVTHKWFFKNIPFPYKFWYPGQFHKENVSFVTSLFEDEDRDNVIETELHKQAQECLTLLSHRLGEKEYFFGENPSSLDALIFSYLVLLLKVELKLPALQNHIKASPNLYTFVNKILQRQFPSESKNAKEKDIPVDEVPNKGRNLFISGLAASTAMLTYAISSGLVQVDIKESLSEHSKDFSYDDYDENSSDD